MACESLQSVPALGLRQSSKSSWTEELPHWGDKPHITCGMLPTLEVLGSRGCECQGSICLVPTDAKTDSASHLQMILLEAYCREIGIEVVRVHSDALRQAIGTEHRDLSCVLITKENYLESPE